MIIYSMTATFGKLEHQTMNLEPGLNVIPAPNEWGKTTWCAFLVNMLYGMETRLHSTKNALADKDRYQPWSGSPMSGRIELNWNGRDITIERRSKSRAPLGEFHAYETKSGLPVPELTGSNCGEQLLGVERDVFIRSAFLRLNDLPVTQNDALRRRLNALVTTGDESGHAEILAQKLKELKNRCRYNRTGLLPQAEAQAAQIENKLRSVRGLNMQAVTIRQRLDELTELRARLENHQDAIHYAAAEKDKLRIEKATAAAEAAQAKAKALEERCAGLPSRGEAETALDQLQQLQQSAMAFQLENEALPQAPVPPAVPAPFHGMTPEEALATVEADTADYPSGTGMGASVGFLVLALFSAVLGIVMFSFSQKVFATLFFALCVIALFIFFLKGCIKRSRAKKYERKYGSDDPAKWHKTAARYMQHVQTYEKRYAAYEASLTRSQKKRAALQEQLQRITGGEPSPAVIARLKDSLALHNAAENARAEYRQAANRLAELQAMAKPVRKPTSPDELKYTEEETNRLLASVSSEQQLLQLRLGQCMGQAEQLGQEESLQRQLSQIKDRIRQLEDTYAALNIALETLSVASVNLQRRFAPRISRRTEELMAQLTDGRYDRITLGEDFRLCLGTQNEDTLLPSQWRSDGTIDQLYVALRLAVAQELIPQVPIVLDDALVRFDDTRLAAAMKVLKKEAESRQVILFSCQSREAQS